MDLVVLNHVVHQYIANVDTRVKDSHLFGEHRRTVQQSTEQKSFLQHENCTPNNQSKHQAIVLEIYIIDYDHCSIKETETECLHIEDVFLELSSKLEQSEKSEEVEQVSDDHCQTQ